MYGNGSSSSLKGPGAPRNESGSRALEAAVAEALRHSGGALPIEDLRSRMDAGGAMREPLARCLRGRADLFLLIERPAGPWREQEWTPAERSEYEASTPATESVLLLDGSAAGTAARAPVLLRESLLTMWGEAPDDDQIRRELGRSVAR